MPYAIYGKDPFRDKRFSALNYLGQRVSKKEDAGTFATREDAQKHLDKYAPEEKRGELLFEIRVIK